jgi:hypothetical protein
MKHLTIESFINSLNEEDIWKIIEDYETYGCDFEAQFLRQKAREYCDKYYYMDNMPFIVIGAYRHFALKYKESLKNE